MNDSRVYGGVHFRHAVEEGAKLGASVAQAVLSEFDSEWWSCLLTASSAGVECLRLLRVRICCRCPCSEVTVRHRNRFIRPIPYLSYLQTSSRRATEGTVQRFEGHLPTGMKPAQMPPLVSAST